MYNEGLGSSKNDVSITTVIIILNILVFEQELESFLQDYSKFCDLKVSIVVSWSSDLQVTQTEFDRPYMNRMN